MTGYSRILSSFGFHRVHRFCPLFLILLIAFAGIFQGCDDDDPVGPAEPTVTPIPTTTPDPTVPPEPTATPEPTETPMYSGEWHGFTWTYTYNTDFCDERSPISFEVMDCRIKAGHIRFCIFWPYWGRSQNIYIPFDAWLEGNSFSVYGIERKGDLTRYWKIEGVFDQLDHISGTWKYEEVYFNESHDFWGGGWSATPN